MVQVMALALDLCSEITGSGISPRISFSHDLNKPDDADENHRTSSDFCLLDSSSDFVFSTSNVIAQQLSAADELFSNGKLIPMEVKKALNVTYGTHTIQPLKPARSYSLPSSNGFTEQKTVKRLKDFLLTGFDTDNDEENTEKPSPKSFWQFKRSCSMNSEATPGKGLIRSLHFLSRSNSTGSVPSAKLTELPKETQKQRLQKQSSVSSTRSSTSTSSSSSNSTTTYYYYNSYQRSSSKKNFGSCNNGVRISPVLNLPQSYMPKATVSFFGFGSLFCNGKIKRKK